MNCTTGVYLLLVSTRLDYSSGWSEQIVHGVCVLACLSNTKAGTHLALKWVACWFS